MVECYGERHRGIKTCLLTVEARNNNNRNNRITVVVNARGRRHGYRCVGFFRLVPHCSPRKPFPLLDYCSRGHLDGVHLLEIWKKPIPRVGSGILPSRTPLAILKYNIWQITMRKDWNSHSCILSYPSPLGFELSGDWLFQHANCFDFRQTSEWLLRCISREKYCLPATFLPPQYPLLASARFLITWATPISNSWGSRLFSFVGKLPALVLALHELRATSFSWVP